MVDHLNPVNAIVSGREAYGPLPVGAMAYFRNMKIWKEYNDKHLERQAKRSKEKREQKEEREEDDKNESSKQLEQLSEKASQLDIIEVNVDESRMQEQAYFLDTGDSILQRGRLHLLNHRFEEAEKDYLMYIHYHDTFGVGFEETLQEYFPAMFEYTLLLSVQDKFNVANHFINLELAQFLSNNVSSYINDKKKSETIIKHIKSLQTEEKLPGLNNYHQRFASKETVALALMMEKEGLHKVAEILLGFIKIRQLLKVFKTDLLIGNLPQSEPVKGGFHITDLPLFYDFTGLSNL